MRKNEYRFHTGYMYEGESDTLFGLYIKMKSAEVDGKEYALLGQYNSMDDVLDSTVIDNCPFREVIMDDNLELLGQD